MSDPILKEAMAKIEAIMKEYQIGGNIALASREGFEFLHYFPKWSVAQFNKEKSSINFRSKREDFESKEQQHKDTEDSVGIVFGIKDLAGRSFLMYDNLAKDLEKNMEISHTPLSGFEKHFDN